MLKLKDYILLAILIIWIGFLYGTQHIIISHLDKIEKNQITAIEKTNNDYLVPAPKKQVEAVISQYYEKDGIITTKATKLSPAVKIKPKKVKLEEVDLNSKAIIDEIAVYIKKKEGFRSHAYKDNTQYSIGYGTKAKSEDEIITVEEANIRLYHHIQQVIIPSFDGVIFQNVEQVHSAIDFSYNLGHNTFKDKIVREDGIIDCKKMMAYNKMRDKEGNLVYNEGLAQRRFENFLACASYEVIEE